ncbi:hypothetical protein L6164_016744 [Bauhinia variegata]|uniref:Uncharacterized protein n=1 Tax=Bauhinia variegata TaxID=167791 RepID=A0ACB9N7P1_BAUVA|nr:hypothetical protein L6164_016744 [Bauhinia variegata]
MMKTIGMMKIPKLTVVFTWPTSFQALLKFLPLQTMILILIIRASTLGYSVVALFIYSEGLNFQKFSLALGIPVGASLIDDLLPLMVTIGSWEYLTHSPTLFTHSIYCILN